jgi:hypothetical protein
MNLMARTAMTKHLIKRQEISFADWYAELREISGDRWGEISDQAPTCFAIWVDGGTPQQCLHMVSAILPARAAA